MYFHTDFKNHSRQGYWMAGYITVVDYRIQQSMPDPKFPTINPDLSSCPQLTGYQCFKKRTFLWQ